MEDFLLIRKIKDGNIKAGDKLVKKYYSLIYKYCLIHVQNSDTAADITQDTFLRFFEAIMQYVEYGKTKNYLYTIARNLINNYHKKRKELLTVETIEIPEYSIDKVDIRLDIEQALKRMPEEVKEVVILFFFQEMKQGDIAKLLNIKISLVKYRVSRGKQILAEYFKEMN